MSEPRPIPKRPPLDDVQYHEFECVECNETTRNTYHEPTRTQMLERRLCFTCNFWLNMERELEKDHAERTIIGGTLYTPGNRTSGAFRGMAGRRFDIEYLSNSVFSGQRTTTFDLWAGGELPARLRERFPDTARFLGGAEKVQVGETDCWNPSSGKTEAYPPPSSLKPAATEVAL